MNQAGIVEIDVHGMNKYQAGVYIDSQIRKAKGSVYRIRVIHGFNRGNQIQKAVYREIGYGLNPKVLRITGGENPGITELVLREF